MNKFRGLHFFILIRFLLGILQLYSETPQEVKKILHFNELLHVIQTIQSKSIGRDENTAPDVLKVLIFIGRYMPLIENHAEILAKFAPICKELAISGTLKEVKNAIRCMYINTQYSSGAEAAPIPSNLDIFPEVIESIKRNLISANKDCCKSIVALGHIAYLMPEKFQGDISKLIKRVAKRTLRDACEDIEVDSSHPTDAWCDKESLPNVTLCQVEVFKMLARWLLGIKQEGQVSRVLKTLTFFIKDALEKYSPAEKSWLRLSAGKAILKICEQSGVGYICTSGQFLVLSSLMYDRTIEVRDLFAKRLHKGLSSRIPQKQLPLGFMAFYALGGCEQDQNLKQLLSSYIKAEVKNLCE